MGTHDTKVKEARSSRRLPLQCSLILANGIQTGEGHILNLSKKGCLVESSLQIKAGDQLQLRFFLPESEQSVCVSLAVVHWVQESRVGVEFLKVDEKYRSRLHQFIVATGTDSWNLAV